MRVHARVYAWRVCFPRCHVHYTITTASHLPPSPLQHHVHRCARSISIVQLYLVIHGNRFSLAYREVFLSPHKIHFLYIYIYICLPFTLHRSLTVSSVLDCPIVVVFSDETRACLYTSIWRAKSYISGRRRNPVVRTKTRAYVSTNTTVHICYPSFPWCFFFFYPPSWLRWRTNCENMFLDENRIRRIMIIKMP